MKEFMNEDFLLTSEAAQNLYHSYAENLPIIDYHCHINPQEIYEDRKFKNITEVWLGGDHYKWRIMRANGVDEKFVTGDGSDREKFQKYAESLSVAIGNPLYHWSHLELKRFFGYNGVLNGDTAEEVWNLCNEQLQKPEFTVRNLIRRSKVDVICTTDDPQDDLKWHKLLKEEKDLGFTVIPAWRPDKAMRINQPGFVPHVQKLEELTGLKINTFEKFIEALNMRMAFFNEMGARESDHALDYVPYVPATPAEIEAIFQKGLKQEEISWDELQQYLTAFMMEMGKGYKKYNWVMQLHYGCKRNNNSKMFEKLGADTGFDCISNVAPASELTNFLDALAKEDQLPKTILYSLNPVDNSLIDSVIGCFQDGKTAGKIQHGSAWWFNDHKMGMSAQLESLASIGVLGNFIGMLTDSRSFLSYPRHEYFRRILCEFLGNLVDNGEYPNDQKALKRIVEGISYYNTKNYFEFKF